MQLPSAIDPELFDSGYRTSPREWRAAILEVCEAHALVSRDVRAFPNGSNLVAAVGERHVVKIFPPFHAHQWESERRTLPRLHGQLSIDVPGLIAQGTREDGWHYLIIDLLPGVTVETAWPQMTHDDKARVLEQIGRAMASAHALAVGELSSLPPEWNGFIRAQAVACAARHARLSMPEWVVAAIPVCVGDGAAFEAPTAERVILTGEYTPFNLLAQRVSSGWQLSGMIDLGDAMIGPREYDLLGPSLFLGEGDAALIASLLRGYFGEERTLEQRERMHLIALALLHRYANLDKQIRFIDWRARAGSLEALACVIWPTA